MYVIINGSFGVGKSSVARELRCLLPGALIFDPERVGFVLQRIPGRRRADFQHQPLWRRLTVLGARCYAAVSRFVIIPMTFSETRYLDEVRGGLARGSRPVLHFCLTAPLAVVRQRLASRGEPEDDPRWSWVHRRAAECCAVHSGPAFAAQISTVGASPAQIAASLADRIREQGGGC